MSLAKTPLVVGAFKRPLVSTHYVDSRAPKGAHYEPVATFSAWPLACISQKPKARVLFQTSLLIEFNSVNQVCGLSQSVYTIWQIAV